MSRLVTLVDLGVGNLGNLARAIDRVGAGGTRVTITNDPEAIAASRCLVLPGVGAFAPPREALRGARECALRAALAQGAWLLGICVGFQILFEAGEEFGTTDGLGLLPGRVTRLPEGAPVPHIGWNRLRQVGAHPLLNGLLEANDVDPVQSAGGPQPSILEGQRREGRGRFVYFVHSYAPEQVPAECCLALCRHGRDFPAVAGRDRVFGTQFHPERSGPAGLRLLANFLDLAHGNHPRP